MLKSPLFWKMTSLFGAVLLLLIPIMLIRQVIVERADYRSDVEDAIRQSTSGPQKLVGPLIAIPVTELYTVQEEDKTVERKRSFIHFWLPESLMVDGNQNVEERKIGIYTGQVWHSDLTLKADFDVSRLSELNAPNITLGKPFIVISVWDAASCWLRSFRYYARQAPQKDRRYRLNSGPYSASGSASASPLQVKGYARPARLALTRCRVQWSAPFR